MLQAFVYISVIISITALISLSTKVFKHLPKSIVYTILSIAISCGFLIAGHFYPKQVYPAIDFLTHMDFHDLVLHGMLGFLLFAAALHTNTVDMKQHFGQVMILSTVSVLVTTLILGFCFYLVGIAFGYSHNILYYMIGAAILAPTDAISVMAIFKTHKGVPSRIKNLIIGESLLNDAAALILFVILLEIYILPSHHIGVSSILFILLYVAGGSIALGYIYGKLAANLIRAHQELEFALLITLTIATMGFLIAELIQVSSPLSMVIAGFVLGREMRKDRIHREVVVNLDKIWEVIDSMLNAFLFVLIGLLVLKGTFTVYLFIYSTIVIVLLYLARYIGVLAPLAIYERRFDKRFLKDNYILTQGGVKGAISIALALSIPNGHEGALMVIYITVLFSILAQPFIFKHALKYI